jgi:hypothetical protein
MHPFKLFAYLESDIRAKVAKLEVEVEEAKNGAAERNGGEDGSLNPEKASRPCPECGHKSRSLVVTERERYGIIIANIRPL